MATKWSIASGVAAAVLLWGTVAAAAAAPVTLVLWHMEQPPQRVARIQELIEAFNKTHPDILVKQEPQSWGEIYAKAPAAIAAGNAPDMLFATPDFTPVLKDLGALQSVDGFVKQLDGQHHFVPSGLAPYSYDNGVWAVPLYNMAMSLWYRKSVFEKAGLKPPKTWSEWKAAAEKLTADGRYGIGLPANKQLYTDQTVYDLMVNAGAADIYNPDGTLRFDNPETVKAYDFYKDLYQFSAADAPSWTWGEAEACFASGGCGMVLQFTVISTYDSQAEGEAADLGVAPIPHADDRSDSATIAYSNAVMILAKDEAKRKASETFIAWLLEPEVYGHFLNMEPGLFLPVTADGAKAKSLWSDPLAVKYNPQIEAMIANSRNGALFGFTGGRIFPSIAAISAQNILAETLQKVVVDDTPAAEAVKAGQARMQEAVK